MCSCSPRTLWGISCSSSKRYFRQHCNHFKYQITLLTRSEMESLHQIVPAKCIWAELHTNYYDWSMFPVVRDVFLMFTNWSSVLQGDERVRTALFKLRQTWKAIFPERKLYALDLNTQAVDPNWPVCATAPIHVNPKFFKKPPSEVRRLVV